MIFLNSSHSLSRVALLTLKTNITSGMGPSLFQLCLNFVDISGTNITYVCRNSQRYKMYKIALLVNIMYVCMYMYISVYVHMSICRYKYMCVVCVCMLYVCVEQTIS